SVQGSIAFQGPGIGLSRSIVQTKSKFETPMGIGSGQGQAVPDAPMVGELPWDHGFEMIVVLVVRIAQPAAERITLFVDQQLNSPDPIAADFPRELLLVLESLGCRTDTVDHFMETLSPNIKPVSFVIEAQGKLLAPGNREAGFI